MDCEVEVIKRSTFEQFKGKNLIIIEQEADRCFTVHQWSEDGVAPQSSYDTAPEAIARAMQLLKVKQVVGPQDWPEVACIGGLP